MRLVLRQIKIAPSCDALKFLRAEGEFKQDIDVRGKRADEALSIVTDLIDDAALVYVKRVSILHGKGNGILRQLIRDYLKTQSEVKNISDAHADAGGAGITIVELK